MLIVTIFFPHDDTFKIYSVQFSHSVLSNSLLPPWTAARQASLSTTNSQSSLKLMSIELVMPSNHLITHLATFKYIVQFCSLSQHAVHYIPRTYLSYTWKFVLFDHLHPFSSTVNLCLWQPQICSLY